MLFNLTHEDKYYVSAKAPNSLPEENYTFVEINYSKNRIKSIKGSMNFEIEKECILSDLDISSYMDKLNKFLERDDIDKDKIHLNFVETVENENERIKKIFIILLSSYLIYFNFLEFPFTISLDLLTNKMFSYFTSFTPTNDIEKSFVKQVSLFHRYFSTIFEDVDTNEGNTNDNFEDLIKEKLDKEVKNLAKDIKEFKRKLLTDVNNKNENLKKEVIDNVTKNIFQKFSNFFSNKNDD